jgi:hypothetical protein
MCDTPLGYQAQVSFAAAQLHAGMQLCARSLSVVPYSLVVVGVMGLRVDAFVPCWHNLLARGQPCWHAGSLVHAHVVLQALVLPACRRHSTTHSR